VGTVTCIRHPIYESILTRAANICADLIVTDCHTGLPLAPSLLQLTDWELARLSPVPVLIVKRSRLYRRPRILAAVDPTHAYAKPLRLDAQILNCGASMCKALRGTLHAVHAYVPGLSGVEPASSVVAGTAFRIDAIAAAEARGGFNKVLHSSAIAAECRHLRSGHPVDCIKRVAAETAADLVVMGSMARSGLQRLLIGNTAEKLLYRLPCDLLLLKPPAIVNVLSLRHCGASVVQTTSCD
jgi:universal stress protein E